MFVPAQMEITFQFVVGGGAKSGIPLAQTVIEIAVTHQLDLPNSILQGKDIEIDLGFDGPISFERELRIQNGEMKVALVTFDSRKFAPHDATDITTACDDVAYNLTVLRMAGLVPSVRIIELHGHQKAEIFALIEKLSSEVEAENKFAREN